MLSIPPCNSSFNLLDPVEIFNIFFLFSNNYNPLVNPTSPTFMAASIILSTFGSDKPFILHRFFFTVIRTDITVWYPSLLSLFISLGLIPSSSNASTFKG